MINTKKLNDVLVSYKADFNEWWKVEKFKWQAVKQFQDSWDINADDFYGMLENALSKTKNLLDSFRVYAKGMILEFAKKDPEAVKEMFQDLFDETKSLEERMSDFNTRSEELRVEYGKGEWKSHYQDANTISTYLWLRYPDKYYIYKYSEFVKVAKLLESDFVPKRGTSFNEISSCFALYDELCTCLVNDQELVGLMNGQVDDSCYIDSNLKTLTIDVGFYISRKYNTTQGQEDTWHPQDYDPEITIEQWIELLNDPEVFTVTSLQIMKRIKDYGGEATCTQLSLKYGESANFYNTGSSTLAKRVAKKMNCPVKMDQLNNPNWWPILYFGKDASKEVKGTFIWKLRNELSEALEKIDLSNVPLYSNQSQKETKQNQNYWWLNANPSIWSYSDLSVGESQYYTMYNENGNKRRVFQNFLDVREGDIVIGYESRPTKQITTLCRISQENDGQCIGIEKVEALKNPIDYSIIKSSEELQNMEYFINPQGSLFKLTKEEYNFIMELVRESNPVVSNKKNKEYSKEMFLNDVYMDGTEYDTLTSVLKKKLNLIIQGAPGVGKTYSAKKLAYSMMGEVDEERIEMVQFHQNYTYEDFIMGYKPHEDGFKLTNGIFYQFCQKAQNDPQRKYFFIIDEINRGNMSKIFGELLMLIENDHRNEKITLAYSGAKFYVPDNLYIIGLMNTADRSLAMIDYALRRRFSFYEMKPGFDSDGFKKYQAEFENETFNSLISVIKDLNSHITDDESLGSGFCIGHSYFCNCKNCTDEWMKEIIYFEILPMLQEYWFDNKKEVDTWESKLLGVFHD